MNDLAAKFRAIRAEFPALEPQPERPRLVYVDNAATTLKPRRVIAALCDHYARGGGNVRRSAHALGELSTERYEQSRAAACAFFNAAEPAEIVFTSGTTASIQLVAQGFVAPSLRAGDEIAISALEHHANLAPWRRLCDERGAVLRVIPVADDGTLDLDAYRALLSPRTRLVAVAAVSNVLGTITPIAELSALAHAQGAAVLVDGAQAAPHLPVDVRAWDCDFFACSAHKLYAPTGLGVLYGKRALLERVEPVAAGGGSLRSASFDALAYADLPARLEPGTPPIGAAIGFGAALSFVSELGRADIARHERTLLQRATAALAAIPGLRILGQAPDKAPIVSFTVEGVHPHDLATLLDRDGIAVRAGSHCAQPILRRFGADAATRASFSFYNTAEEVDALAEAVARAVQRLR